jgi:hypothetical protein
MDLNTPFPLFALVQNRISLGHFHEMKVTDGIRRLILPGANQ